MLVLIVAPREETRDLMRLTVRSVERRLGEPVEFLDADNGERGRLVAMRRHPDAIVCDEFASREGAFSLARTLRGAAEPYTGAIVILLDRPQDRWLARWSGADAWFVKPVDPFELSDALVDAVTQRAAARPGEETA